MVNSGSVPSLRREHRREKFSLTKDGVTPFGPTARLRMFVDLDLLQYDEVWATAGRWNNSFDATPTDIVRVAFGVFIDFKSLVIAFKNRVD